MFYANKSQESKYRLLYNAGEGEECGRSDFSPLERQTRRRLLLALLICCTAFILFIIGFASGAYLKDISIWRSNTYTPFSTMCKNPPLRREWRSLDRAEKHDYIEAVKCLKTVPSQVGENQTLYDDFPWVHMHYGEYCTSPCLAFLVTRTLTA